MKVAHASTNSVFVLEPSLQLKSHLTSGEFGIFKVPPALQVVPPLMDVLSKKVSEYPWIEHIGLSLKNLGLISVCVGKGI
jgi:hypothetical protein